MRRASSSSLPGGLLLSPSPSPSPSSSASWNLARLRLSTAAAATPPAAATSSAPKQPGSGSPVSTASTSPVRRKRRLAPQLGRWERVMPASSRMLDFLRGTGATTAASAAAAAHPSPASVTSALQLSRFYLERGDLKAAQELLFSLQDGRLGSTVTPLQVPPALLRPLFQRLVQALIQAGDATSALQTAQRMAKAGQAPTPDLAAGLLTACRGQVDLVAVWWAAQPPHAWADDPAICLALLDVLGKTHGKAAAWHALPDVEAVWTALGRHGPPPASAYAARIQGLAAADATVAGTVSVLVQAVHDFAGHVSDEQARHLVLRTAAEAMLRWRNVDGLRQVLAALPTHDGRLFTHLIESLPLQSLAALDVLWQHATQAGGPCPLGLVLGYCRVALESDSQGHVEQALGMLRGELPADRTASAKQVAAVLDALCTRRLLPEAQALLQAASPFFPPVLPVVLARALLKVASLEGKPGRAIALLHRLVGDEEEEEGKEEGREEEEKERVNATAVQPADYEAVLRALADVHLPSSTGRERALVENPLGFLSWVLDEGLARTSTGLTPAAVHAALQILRRACESPGTEEHHDAFVQRAVAMVSKLAAAGHETDDALCEDLVGVAVWGISLHRAVEVAKEMEHTKAEPGFLARVHALLIQSLARRGDLAGAEEWLVRMVTVTGQGPSERVLDAFATAHAREGDAAAGLSMLQGCFNQYGTRPSPPAFRALFDRCLGQGDQFEAQRALIIAQQLWAAAETELEEEAMQGFLRDLEALLAAMPLPKQAAGEEAGEEGGPNKGV